MHFNNMNSQQQQLCLRSKYEVIFRKEKFIEQFHLYAYMLVSVENKTDFIFLFGIRPVSYIVTFATK